MKKYVIRLLSLVMCCILLLPLATGCIREDLTEVDKFEKLSDTDKAFYLLENDVEYDISKEEMIISWNGMYRNVPSSASLYTATTEIETRDKFLLYGEMDLILDTSDVPYVGSYNRMSINEGWTDGKHFVHTYMHYNATTSEMKRYMEKSKEDYIAEIENGDSTGIENADSYFGITRENCDSVSYIKNEDGSRNATFVSTSEACLSEFKTILVFFEEFIDVESLSKVTFTITYSEDLKLVSSSAVFEFGGKQNDDITFVCNFYESKDVEEPKIDLTGYEKVSSLD